MIISQTKLGIKDNSGPKELKCIQVLNKSKKKPGSLGSELVVSVSSMKFKEKAKLKLGKVYHSVVTSCKTKTKREDGSTLKSSMNLAILVQQNQNPYASRVRLSYCFREVSKKKKLISLVKYLI